jgi:hypothetical protein
MLQKTIILQIVVREDCELNVFGNGALKRNFKPKIKEEKGRWKR